jgi:YD repeat-containing protein
MNDIIKQLFIFICVGVLSCGLVFGKGVSRKKNISKPELYPVAKELNSFGQPESYTFANKAIITFLYDKIGRVRKHIMPDGSIVSFQYKKNSLIHKQNESRSTNYEYDDFGRLIRKTISQDKARLTETRKYDSRGNLISISEGNKNTINFLYDRFGRKLVETGLTGSIKYLYDDFGRLKIREVQLKGKTKKFQTHFWYNRNWIARVYSPSGRFHFSCDRKKKRLSHIEFFINKSVRRQKQPTYIIKNEYNKDGRITSKSFTFNKDKPLQVASYQYNKSNQVVKETSFGAKWEYQYNKYNQLVVAKSNQGKEYNYSYDNIGNCVQYGELNFSYNDMWQISSPGYCYDAFGNLTESPGSKYRYDLKDRLIELKISDKTMSFQYDPMNQLVSCVIKHSASGIKSRTDFLMSGMIEYARSVNGEAIYHTFTPNVINKAHRVKNPIVLLASSYAENKSVYYISGMDGSIVASFNAAKSGNLNEISYSPFGREISNGSHDALPFGFKLRPLIVEDLYFYNGLFYSTKLYGYLTRGNKMYIKGNPYAFENNSPIGETLDFIDIGRIDEDINRYKKIKLIPEKIFITK